MTMCKYEQKLANLKNLGISIKNQESDFSIMAYDAVVSALSRDLKKVDNETVNDIMENLFSLVREEKKAADNIRAGNAKQCQQIIETIRSFKIQESKMEQDLDRRDEILSDIDQKIQLISGKKA